MYLRKKEDLKVGDRLKNKTTNQIIELTKGDWNDFKGLIVKGLPVIITLDSLNLDEFEYVETQEEIAERKRQQEITAAAQRTHAYEECNAGKVLEVVNRLINNYTGRPYDMRSVYNDLSIFDWWTEQLGKNRLLEMRTFLREAIKLGFTGYVCFKVGMEGCANGMWAHKEKSTTGYSPDGPTLYKSFTPSYNYWAVDIDGNGMLPGKDKYDSIKTIKQLEELYNELEGLK